jgi:hypothetical protein
MIKPYQIFYAPDDIPFGAGANPNPKPAPVAQESGEIDADLSHERSMADAAKRPIPTISDAATLNRPQQSLQRIEPLPAGITQKEIFLAIVQGMAANGDFTVGSKLNTDDTIRAAGRHAAGISKYFFTAAKNAGI